jgi:hypothetical protein
LEFIPFKLSTLKEENKCSGILLIRLGLC